MFERRIWGSASNHFHSHVGEPSACLLGIPVIVSFVPLALAPFYGRHLGPVGFLLCACAYSCARVEGCIEGGCIRDWSIEVEWHTSSWPLARSLVHILSCPPRCNPTLVLTFCASTFINLTDNSLTTLYQTNKQQRNLLSCPPEIGLVKLRLLPLKKRLASYPALTYSHRVI